jgi:hypothetical protein
MKNLMKSTLILGLLIFAIACSKKETVDPNVGFSTQIKNIVPQTIIDDLKARGMPINEGTIPPKIEGIYLSSPHTLEVPYGTDDSYKKGYEFSDLIMRFSNQKDDGSITIETKNAGAISTGIGGFLSGNGNKFSIFAELKYVDGSVTATQIRVFSGEITTSGIKDFYTTILIKDKVDPSGTLFPVGKSRILKDGDGLASKTSSFRIGAISDIPNLSSDCSK